MAGRQIQAAKMAAARLKKDRQSNQAPKAGQADTPQLSELSPVMADEAILGAVQQMLLASRVVQKAEQVFAYPPLKISFYFNYPYLFHLDIKRTDHKGFWDDIDLSPLADPENDPPEGSE